MNPLARQVGLISNPTSGHNRKQFPRIQERIERNNAIRHIITETAADIAPALEQLAREDISLLAINGGDGTASAVLGQLLESDYFQSPPVIAILPGGTANMNAGDIGIKGSLLRATDRFCKWCEADGDSGNRLQRRSLLRVTLSTDQAPHFGMFLGGGAIIQGTEYAHEKVHSRGLRDDLSLALTTVRTVWGILRGNPRFNQPVGVRLSMDAGAYRQHDALIVAISTLHRLAFGMRPFWGEGPGNLRLTLIEQQCSQFARTFFSIVRGKPNCNATPESGYLSMNGEQLTLQIDGKLNLDGEILEPLGAVQISASQPLEFLVL